MHPHHRPSASDGITEPIPGLVAGGPDKGLDDATLLALYNSSTPPALCYADNQNSYASNEIAINWNAPLVFVAGYFSGKKELTGIKTKAAAIPDKILLEQNYPNPFNPTTTIRYQITNNTFVQLKVYNILGEEVKTLVSKVEQPGYHEVKFNASNLTSGVYLLSLKAGNYFSVKKMMLMK